MKAVDRRVRGLKRSVLAASLVSFGMLTVAAEHHVAGVTAHAQAAALKHPLGVLPAPERQASTGYEFGQVSQSSTAPAGYTTPVTSTGVS